MTAATNTHEGHVRRGEGVTRVRTAAGTVHSVRRWIPSGGGSFDGRPIDLPELSCGRRLPAAWGPTDDEAVTCRSCLPRSDTDERNMRAVCRDSELAGELMEEEEREVTPLYAVAVITRRDGVIEVHAAGCADVAKSAKRHGDEPWELEVPSRVELSHEYWADVISDEQDPNSAEGWETAVGWATSQFDFKPCAAEVPFGESPFADEACPACGEPIDYCQGHGEIGDPEGAAILAAERDEAPEPVVSLWVGWRIADVAIDRGSSLGAKLAARKPNKVLDRTVRLTRDELVELVKVAESVRDGAAHDGPLLYSATTHIARLRKLVEYF